MKKTTVITLLMASILTTASAGFSFMGDMIKDMRDAAQEMKEEVTDGAKDMKDEMRDAKTEIIDNAKDMKPENITLSNDKNETVKDKNETI